MVDLRDEPKAATPASGAALGLRQAIALIVGCVIGVSIFNLPYSLASIGPISLVAMVLTTFCARPRPGVRRIVEAVAGRRRPLHLRACRLRQRRGVRECRRRSRLLHPVHRGLPEWRPGALVLEPGTAPPDRG